MKKKLRQKGIDPVTHKPLSEVENLEDNVKSQEKVAQVSNELNLLKSESSKSDAASCDHRTSTSLSPKAYAQEMDGSGSYTKSESSNLMNSKDMFLDKFMNHQTDLMANFPLQMSFSNTENDCLTNDSNSSHWFNQTGKTFDMNSEFPFNSNSILTPTTTTSTTTMFLPNSFCCNDSSLATIHSDNVSTPCGSNYWEVNRSDNRSNNSSTLNLQNNIFSSWGLADCSINSTKEAQIHDMIEHNHAEEEAKWENNYLHNPILMLASESLCNEIKPSMMQLVPHDTLGAILPHTKQQEQSQASNIFSKDIQKLRAAFGDM